MKSKGRPFRDDQPVRVTLYLARKTKSKLFELAMSRDASMSRVADALIEEEIARIAAASARPGRRDAKAQADVIEEEAGL